MNEFTFGSLFSGIGGLDLGLERSGMKLIWQVEKEKYERKVLEKNWPNVKRFINVKECGEHNLEKVDLIAGGFPCQDVSVAGKRKGLEGNRTTLWSEFARIIRELEPKWVLAENVPGLLSNDSGRFFGKILRDLATCGYDAEWDCIPAAAFGAPHVRYRIFILAYSNSYRINGRGNQNIQEKNNSIQDKGSSMRNKSSILAHTESERTGSISIRQGRQNQTQGNIDGNSKGMVANSNQFRRDKLEQSDSRRTQEQRIIDKITQCGSSWWSIEPDMGRVAYGIPSRVDRIRGLGNAVVPQVAEWLGRLILRADTDNEQENNSST